MCDKLYFNGKITTSENDSYYDAVLIKYNTIYKIGDRHDLLEFVDTKTDLINLHTRKITIEEIKKIEGL